MCVVSRKKNGGGLQGDTSWQERPDATVGHVEKFTTAGAFVVEGEEGGENVTATIRHRDPNQPGGKREGNSLNVIKPVEKRGQPA